MLLRPRQKTFIERAVIALEEHGNSLAVAPTGAGKTVMFSQVTSQILSQPDKRGLVLAHRDELTEQNRTQFSKLNPSVLTSVYDARVKSWDAQVTFAMVQTLSRAENLETMPRLDLLVIDEAHHAVANTYEKIISRARSLNGDCLIFGVTATPNRSDKKGLRRFFTNVADQISVGELVRSGHLVAPRTFVMDVGVTKELSEIEHIGDDYDMRAVERVLNRRPINEQVVEKWKEFASGRQTAVFCSTVAHATEVSDVFHSAGVSSACLTGELDKKARDRILNDYASKKINVLVNVAVLTEGWDHPPTSCVILLRPSSAKSTMLQMIGRGLRTVDSRLHPGISKPDCIILDFGNSSLMHGRLEEDIELDDVPTDGMALTQKCPECESIIPLQAHECPICGQEFGRKVREERVGQLVSSVQMMEINLLAHSNFEWVDIFNDEASYICSGFDAWAGVFRSGSKWYAFGGTSRGRVNLLGQGSRIVCFASADDWINEHETEETAHKSKQWLHEPPTEKQVSALAPGSKLDFNLTRYQASALITFSIHKGEIKKLIDV